MPQSPRPAGLLLAVCAALALGACSGQSNPVRDLAVATGVGSEPRKAPDFVQRSRRSDIDYMPVGLPAPERSVPRKTADQVKAMEAEMGSLRDTNEAKATAARQAGATPAPTAAGPQPAPVPARAEAKKTRPAQP